MNAPSRRLTALLLATCPAPSSLAQAPGFQSEVVAQGLHLVSAMAFAPDGRLFVVERLTGYIKVVEHGAVTGVWGHVPVSSSEFESRGLLGIAIDPDFLRNGHVYVSASNRIGTDDNSVVRLTEVGGVGVNPTDLGPSMFASVIHNIGPLTFGVDGKLYVHTGDALASSTGQNLDSPHGKVFRMNAPDGSIPADNPFGPASYVWTYGHRNAFGLAVHPLSGVIYEVENGAAGADEVNRLIAGGNYGWVTHEGMEVVPDPLTEDPIHTWSPPIGPTGACFYSGALYPAAFRNALFLGDWNRGHLTALELDTAGLSVLSETTVFDYDRELFGVVDGPDGNLWTLTTTGSNRGADRIERVVHANAPFPAVAIGATSRVAVGASLTVGVTANPGDPGVSWVGFSALPAAVPTVFGDFWVPSQIVLPSFNVGSDGRHYVGLSLPNDSSLVASTLHVQAATLSSGAITLTNADSVKLH